MRNFLLLTTTKGSSLHRCTHQQVSLRTATTSGNDREAKAMMAVQIKSLFKCDSNPPLPTVSKRTTAMQQAATTRTPPCSSCHYTKTLQYILKIRSNGSKSSSHNSRKVSKRSPHAARGSLPSSCSIPQPRHSREWQQNPPVRSGGWQNTHGGAPNVANFSTLSIYATAE